MVNLGLLSQNIVNILDMLVSNQRLVKYVYYPDKDPQSKVDLPLPAYNLVNQYFFPVPFNPGSIQEDCVRIHFYFPNGEFKNNHAVADTRVHFEIGIARSLWLIHEGTENKVRPYEIINEICNTFMGKSIGTLGRIDFEGWQHLLTDNDNFDIVQLVGKVVTFGKGV